MENTKKNILSGIVVSDKMAKTIVVRVNRYKIHPKYEKKYLTSKKYHVHDEKNKFKIGDKVKFCQSKPISKRTKWQVYY